MNSFTDGGNFLSEYPIDVYAGCCAFVILVLRLGVRGVLLQFFVSTSPIRWLDPSASPAVALVAAIGAGYVV